MASTLKQFGAVDDGARPSERAPTGEKRTASGSGMGDWLVNVSGDVVVPMTTAEVVDGLRAQKLSERTLVWRLGMHDWTVLGDVPQLRLAAGPTVLNAPHPPPASARMPVAPPQAQAESQRRRNTLPFGFPAARDAAGARRSGSPTTAASARAVSVPRPTPAPRAEPALRAEIVPRPSPAPLADPALDTVARFEAQALTGDESVTALAVYDRPVASLTFADSVAAEWRGESRPPPPAAPPPSVPPSSNRSDAPRSAFPNSLAPTTTEPVPRSVYADLSVVLASDFRAAKASSKRVALWGALGSALLASALTVWLMSGHASEAPTSAPAAQPVAAPALIAPPAPTPPVVAAAPAAPSAVAVKVKSAPRVVRAWRPRSKPSVRPPPSAATSEPVSDNPYPANDPAEPRAPATAEPSAPSEPSAPPSVDSSPSPAPKAEPAPAVDPTPSP